MQAKAWKVFELAICFVCSYGPIDSKCMVIDSYIHYTYIIHYVCYTDTGDASADFVLGGWGQRFAITEMPVQSTGYPHFRPSLLFRILEFPSK